MSDDGVETMMTRALRHGRDVESDGGHSRRTAPSKIRDAGAATGRDVLAGATKLSRDKGCLTGRFMIYGATGYTGKLVSRRAKAMGLEPLLAGRNPMRLHALAEETGLEHCVVDLADGPALRRALGAVDSVLHVAGPFARTAAPMLDACLAARKHYLDVTGEIDVFEFCARRDEAARAMGITVMPGCGFDVVPTDCLAAHVKRRLPDAVALNFAIAALGDRARDLASMSRGTAKTGIGSIGERVRVRRDGCIVALGAPLRREFDFGHGAQRTVAVPWGDVSTAYHSTRIPDITVYFPANRQIELLASLSAPSRWFLGSAPVQRLLRWQVDRQPEGPSDAERETVRAMLVAEVVNQAGVTLRSRLETPDSYTLTAATTIEIMRRVVAGETSPGFQTPSLAFGPDFILGFAGCRREDLNS
jgi:short subunit dehydrogenase-like uncharacterized protein